MINISEDLAREFYSVHSERPFFESMVKYMSSGAVVVQVLEKDGDTVTSYRDLMGATNPAIAEKNTLRRSYGISIEENAGHDSDSLENVQKEIAFFFKKEELCK